jgi:hypothetical protein
MLRQMIIQAEFWAYQTIETEPIGDAMYDSNLTRCIGHVDCSDCKCLSRQ